jgi:hypothetical protein
VPVGHRHYHSDIRPSGNKYRDGDRVNAGGRDSASISKLRGLVSVVPIVWSWNCPRS